MRRWWEVGLGLELTRLHNDQGNAQLGDVRAIEVFMCSVVKKQGYGEGVFALVGLARGSHLRSNHDFSLFRRFPLAVAIH